MLQKHGNLKKVVEGFNQDSSAIYFTYLPKIKAGIVKLDKLSGFKRKSAELDELALDFAIHVLEKNLFSEFDYSRAKSKDPIFSFLFNHLRNFYRDVKNKEKQNEEIKQQHMLRAGLGGTKGLISADEMDQLKKRADQDHPIEAYEESKDFCADIKKISKSFIRSLKGLEKKAWKWFLEENASIQEVANRLGVSNRTTNSLKASIKIKAQKHMNDGGYFASNINYK